MIYSAIFPWFFSIHSPYNSVQLRAQRTLCETSQRDRA
jgi:hypothetical protein